MRIISYEFRLPFFAPDDLSGGDNDAWLDALLAEYGTPAKKNKNGKKKKNAGTSGAKPSFDPGADDFLEPIKDETSEDTASDAPAVPLVKPVTEPTRAEMAGMPDLPAPEAADAAQYVSPYEALDAWRNEEKNHKPLVRPATQTRYDDPYGVNRAGSAGANRSTPETEDVPESSDKRDESDATENNGEVNAGIAPEGGNDTPKVRVSVYAKDPSALSDEERAELALAAEKIRAAQKARNEAVRAQNAAKEAGQSETAGTTDEEAAAPRSVPDMPDRETDVSDRETDDAFVTFTESDEPDATRLSDEGTADENGYDADRPGNGVSTDGRTVPGDESDGFIPPVDALLALEDEDPDSAPVARWKKKWNVRPDAVSEEDTRTSHLKITVFAVGMLLAFLIGILIPLRPVFSESEKRALTPFPTITAKGFFSGAFFSDVETWYADSYPGREGLLGVNNLFRSLYGFRGEQITHGGQSETIDSQLPEDLDSYLESLEESRRAESKETEKGGESGESGSETDPDRGGEKINGLYVTGDTAYELSYYNETAAMTYAALISRAANLLGDGVKVYDVIVPLSYSLYLSADRQNALGLADAEEAIAHVYKAIGQNSTARTVDILPALKTHKDEYLYFRTDHHWTARGAYHAYTAFCEAAGLTARSLTDWDAYSFDGFLGTLFSEANAPAAMRNRPDTVEAWIPNGTNTIYITDKTGERLKYTGGLVRKDTDTFYQSASSKYNCFLMGDSPLCEIHNPDVTNGSSIAVVKESFGNAFVPFLVDSYEYVYVLDYRYFNGTLPEFVAERGIGEVLFINNAVAVWSKNSPRLNEMMDFIGN